MIANWETVEIADLGTKEPGNQGTGIQGTREPRDQGTKELENRGTREPRDQGTEGPGTKGPGNQAKASHEVGGMRRDLRERLQDLTVRKSQDSMCCH